MTINQIFNGIIAIAGLGGLVQATVWFVGGAYLPAVLWAAVACGVFYIGYTQKNEGEASWRDVIRHLNKQAKASRKQQH